MNHNIDYTESVPCDYVDLHGITSSLQLYTIITINHV